jgi:hypothetical protein
VSRINGDKSRYHRMRKQKVQRRMRNQVMFTQIASEAVTAAQGPKASPPVAVSKRIDAAHE